MCYRCQEKQLLVSAHAMCSAGMPVLVACPFWPALACLCWPVLVACPVNRGPCRWLGLTQHMKLAPKRVPDLQAKQRRLNASGVGIP